MTRRARLTGLTVLVVALLFLGRWTAGALADQWWAARLSADGAAFLFERRLLRLTLDVGAVLVASAWFIGHLFVVYRSIGVVEVPRHVANVEFRETLTPRALLVGAAVLGLLLGLLVGGGASSAWDTVALAWHGVSYGVREPLLGRDLGFYVARLPLWRDLHGFALLLVLLAFTGALTLYIVVGAVRWLDGRPALNDHARTHLGWLLAALALVLAWGYLLEPYELVAGLDGPADPGSFRVVATVSPILAGIALAAAVLSAVWALRARHLLLVAGWIVLGLASGAGHYLLPALGREPGAVPLAADMARRLEGIAYGLDAMVDTAFAGVPADSGPPAVPALWGDRLAEQILSEDTTAGPSPEPAMLPTASGSRPVWLAMRPLASGSAAFLALADDRVGAGGTPLFYRPGDSVAYPRAYPFAEIPATAVRLDAPRYDLGPRALGDSAGGWVRRLLLAWALQAPRILESTAPGDRIAWYLNPGDRLAHLAPFADWGTPSPRLVRNEVVWLAPGYVVSPLFPLTPRVGWHGGTASSVRLGFIGVVVARTGETRVYLAPGADSLASAWAGLAGGMVQPAAALPPAEAAALGYPVDLFRAQTSMLERSRAWNLGSLARLEDEGDEPTGGLVWGTDARSPARIAAFEQGNEHLAAVLTAEMVAGRPVLRLARLDSASTLPTPTRLRSRWAGFPLFAQLDDSTKAEGGQLKPGPVRLRLGGPTLEAYQPVYGMRSGVRPAVVWINVAAGPKLGAGRDLADAWRNLRGETVPAPPKQPTPPDRLEEARRWWQAADSALRRGDWTRFGHAFEMLRDLLGARPAARGRP